MYSLIRACKCVAIGAPPRAGAPRRRATVARSTDSDPETVMSTSLRLLTMISLPIAMAVTFLARPLVFVVGGADVELKLEAGTYLRVFGEDLNLNVLGMIPTEGLSDTVKGLGNVHSIIVVGKISRDLVSAAERIRCRYLVGSESERSSRAVQIITNL